MKKTIRDIGAWVRLLEEREQRESGKLGAMRDALVRARASSQRQIVYRANGIERSVDFRNDAEMRVALADIERRLGAAEGRSSVNVVNITSVKGFA